MDHTFPEDMVCPTKCFIMIILTITPMRNYRFTSSLFIESGFMKMFSVDGDLSSNN